MAEIQINATGGDVAEQTSMQAGEGLTATDPLPVLLSVEQFSAHEKEERTEAEFSQDGPAIIPLPEYEDPLHCEDPVMHISGTGHWFLEGWIGDHSVDFLVDSGSSVTAMSDILYKNLVQAGASVGALQITARTLRSANGTGIEVLGCSRCSVSFLGLRMEFPIIICSLAAGTDAIIGTDVLGSVLPHTLDIRMDCCLHELHCNCTGEIQPYQVAFLRWAIHQYRHIQRLFCTAPSGLLVAVHCHLAACWRD